MTDLFYNLEGVKLPFLVTDQSGGIFASRKEELRLTKTNASNASATANNVYLSNFE